MSVCEHFFEHKEELVAALSGRIARRLHSAIECDGAASLFVSGGSTPVALFDTLAHEDIDWSATTVGLVDERWVDETHEASNTALVKRHLLVDRARDARYWPMFRGGDIGAAVAAMRADLPLAGRGPTVAHIGLGGDLHTASIFPAGSATREALRDDGPDVVHMFPTGTPANPPYHRATLTKAILARAGLLVLLIEGEAKLARYREARELPLRAADDAPVVAFLADDRIAVEVYWSP